jgi:pimeloyl-ACP methyl ester carboxylesterase
MNPSEFHSTRKFAETPFGKIAYLERGSGPVALFVHGLPLCGYEWRGVVEDLAPVRRCVAPDMMGLGYTEVPPDRDVSFAAQAKMLAAFLDALRIDVVDLVGNDTGGGVSQIFAAEHPARVRSLALTNCEVHDRWPNALLAGFYEGVRAGVVPQAMKQMLRDVKLAREQLAALVYEDAEIFTPEIVELYLAPCVASEARIALFQKLSDWQTNRGQLMNVAAKLRASTVPAMVVWGDGDVVFDTEPSLAWFRENLGGLQKTTILPRGKLFFPEEHPRATSVLLREFWVENETAEIMRRFNDGFQRHDSSVFPELVGDDCVIENTGPAPDGARILGRKACVELWQGIATSPAIRFDLEDVVVRGDRAMIFWRLHHGNGGDSVRGVNLMRVQGGRIVEGRGYVKS